LVSVSKYCVDELFGPSSMRDNFTDLLVMHS
jgi:hypothetical protein